MAAVEIPDDLFDGGLAASRKWAFWEMERVAPQAARIAHEDFAVTVEALYRAFTGCVQVGVQRANLAKANSLLRTVQRFYDVAVAESEKMIVSSLRGRAPDLFQV